MCTLPTVRLSVPNSEYVSELHRERLICYWLIVNTTNMRVRGVKAGFGKRSLPLHRIAKASRAAAGYAFQELTEFIS